MTDCRLGFACDVHNDRLKPSVKEQVQTRDRKERWGAQGRVQAQLCVQGTRGQNPGANGARQGKVLESSGQTKAFSKGSALCAMRTRTDRESKCREEKERVMESSRRTAAPACVQRFQGQNTGFAIGEDKQNGVMEDSGQSAGPACVQCMWRQP